MVNQNKQTVLVLGASGLLGWQCYESLNQEYNVILTYKNNYLPNVNGIKFDVLDGIEVIEYLIKKYQPDIVINTIALVTVDGCEKDPELAKRLNVDFVRDLVMTMKKYDLNKSYLIQISSDSVYGENEKVRKTPWSENDQVNPMSVYALTKLKSEDEASKHLGNTLILRTAFYGINPFSKKSLLSWIMDNAVNGREMDGWENVYFSPVSTIQLVEAINALVKKTETGIFNVGSIDACNKFDFVDAVCENSGYSPKINRVKSNLTRDQKIRPEFSVLNSEKLSSVIPWNSTWRSGLDEYLKIRNSFHLG